MKSPLVIRKSDRAIFEPSYPDEMEQPLVTMADTRNFMNMLDSVPDYYFRRLVPVKRSYWFGSKLVRTGEIWEPTDDSLFDVAEKREVLAGLRMQEQAQRRFLKRISSTVSELKRL